ncbi:MAG: phosphomannomutase/phosphoglucomutase [Bacteroidetes bacterium HGW-Bacteroidetes-1]|jgi:phosphomannomutase|nr:MAG: phosphomannomutase/phosphoglucomutase [Bacteroidetes bacterium HGW-Bacteroidetes-1]
MKAFKAYDIRGIWNKDFNKEDVYKIGFFLPIILKTKHVLVGRDCRISSDAIFNALVDGITDSGANVSDAGLTTTPMIYWGTGKFEFGGSVMITASHNPKDHNGLKVSAANALPVGYDTGLSKLEELVESGVVKPASKKGMVQPIEISKPYLEFLNQYNGDFSTLRFGVDCSNGMASLFVKQLFGNQAFYINDTMDGAFPGHEPNPLEPENQEQIKRLVINRQCDFGIIFDGDADRVMFIDENGRFVSPDLIIALMGHYFFEQKGLKGLVLQDIRSSRSVSEYLEQFGATVETWRVGRAYGASKLREINGLFGGELAGHYYFRDFYYSDSGLVAALIVLQLLNSFKAAGFNFSHLIKNICPYYNSGELNFKIERKQEAMNNIVDYFCSQGKPNQILDFDGYRLDYPDFWFNIRPSNTEPYLRFIAEAKDETKLNYIKNKVTEIIHRLN